MRILIAADQFPPGSGGGAETSTYLLAREYLRQGHEVLVFTTSQERRGEDTWSEEIDGIEKLVAYTRYAIRFRPYLSLYNPKGVQAFARLLDRRRFDVVHFNNIHTYISYHAIACARRAGVPSVVTLRDCMAFDYGQYTGGIDPEDLSERPAMRYRVRPLEQWRRRPKGYNPVRNAAIRRYLARADRRVAISHELRRALEANGIDDVEVVYNGIDPAQFSCSEAAVEGLRDRLQLCGHKVLFWGGRPTRRKGIRQTLAALERVCAEEPSALLLLAAGTGPETQGAIEDVARRGLGDHVRVAGWLAGEDLVAAYRASDVVLFPSVYLDPFGRVNIEAMASGRPVVSTCFGGAPEVNLDGVTGYVVNPFDVKTYAARIVALLRDPALARRMGEAGRRRVESEFRSDKIAARYLDMFAALDREAQGAG